MMLLVLFLISPKCILLTFQDRSCNWCQAPSVTSLPEFVVNQFRWGPSLPSCELFKKKKHLPNPIHSICTNLQEITIFQNQMSTKRQVMYGNPEIKLTSTWLAVHHQIAKRILLWILQHFLHSHQVHELPYHQHNKCGGPRTSTVAYCSMYGW